MRARSHGVSAGPAMPSRAASATARSTAARATSSGRASSAGTGTQTRIAGRQTEPEVGPDERRPRPRDVRRRSPVPGSPTSARRSRAAPPGRSPRPGRPGSRGIPAWPGRRGWPWGRRRRRPSACGPSSSRSDEMSKRRRRTPGASPAEGAAMDAADPAGREDRDPGGVGRDHRGRDGRRRPAAVGQRGGEARPRRLADRARRRRGQRLEGRLVQADQQPPAVDRHGGRDRAARPDRRFRGAGDLEVLGVRQAVADQGGLEGDDRPALGQGRRDLRRSDDARRVARIVDGRSSRATARAAASVSWRAAARWPARAATLERRGRRQPGRARREPADEEPGVERVAGAGGVARGDMSRRDLERGGDPAGPGEDAWRPSRPRLTTATGAKSSRPSFGSAAEERVRLRARWRT